MRRGLARGSRRRPFTWVAESRATSFDNAAVNSPDMDPSPLASILIVGDEVRLLTYIRPRVDLDQPRSGHDGLFARQLPIGLSGS